MDTHAAIVTVAPRASLELHHVPSPKPTGNEVRVRNEWTTSGPLDLHKADGGLLVKHPEVLGGGVSGTVVEVGDEVRKLKIGDKVFGYGFREQKEKAHQQFSIMPEFLLGKIPPNLSMQAAATIPTNLITIFHTLTTHFSMALPWPKPASYTPPSSTNLPILVWGASSSVGQYALQILSYYGYTTIIATASPTHHSLLKQLGATHVVDYRDFDALSSTVEELGPVVYWLDCIGSVSGSVKPISRLARSGAQVAVMLPVIIRDASVDEAPVYAMDVNDCGVQWAEGVEALGVRTHFYLQNEEFRGRLQSEIVPQAVEMGVVKANEVRVVEGENMLERAQKALDLLRGKEVRGEKLVWRID